MNAAGWYLCTTWREARWFKTKAAGSAALKEWRLGLEAKGWTKLWGGAARGYAMLSPGRDPDLPIVPLSDSPVEGVLACFLRPASEPLHPETIVHA